MPQSTSTPASLHIGIVGAGPRGLWAVEELAAHARAHRVPIAVDVWDPAPPGAGSAYSPEQPDYWTLNVSSRIINSSLGLFDDWRRARGESEPLSHFPPRALVGQFLAESWQHIGEQAAPFCTVRHVKSRVTSVQRSDNDDSSWVLSSDDAPTQEYQREYQEVLLVTGHEQNWSGALPRDSRTVGAYPPEQLRGITEGAVVASRGTALTFIDAALELTEGRGGVFARGAAGELEYQRSGREPGTVFPVGRGGRFMEVKPDPDTPLANYRDDAALEAACIAVRTCSNIDELTAALADYAATLLSVAGAANPRVRDEVANIPAVIAGADFRDDESAIEAFRCSRDIAVGATSPGARWAVGQAFRQMYPTIVSRVANQNREPLHEEFYRLARILERVAFGPTSENASKLLALIKSGCVDCGRLTSSRFLDEADFVIDAVLAPQGMLPEMLVAQVLGGQELRVDGAGGVEGFAGLSVIGRAAEIRLPGSDTLSRELHNVVPRWARRVVTQHRVTAIGNPRAHATVPLTGRLEPWMIELLEQPQVCESLVEQHQSPINVHHPAPVLRNINELTAAGQDFGVEVRVFMARKANKTLSIVDAMRDAGHGVDVASQRELEQVLQRGVPGGRIIVSSAIKPDVFLTRAIDAGAVISVDAPAEANRAMAIAAERGTRVQVAPRLAPDPATLPATRFGASVETWNSWLRTLGTSAHAEDGAGPIDVVGVHVHLHGYSASDRCIALEQALQIVDQARECGHAVEFVDLGGGVPMSYLDDRHQWDAFLEQRANLDSMHAEQFTWKNDPLQSIYPFHQEPTRGDWLRQLLGGMLTDGGTRRSAADALASRGLRLHLEPGRSVLDGAGMTLARVAFLKERSDGVPLIGLEMNRTQCRTTTDDILVDPILVPCASNGGSGRGSDRGASSVYSGFLVGAYCIEDEVIVRRRIVFPEGIAVGDIVALPNTGGYFMHILESASHQIPLAVNLTTNGADELGFTLDPIDQ
ncbi:FAD/NAD(P)-binding protein [Corynebacterium sp. H113]|uniref:FAD/NAD(P)-binding protein n=1 Tax=Corynebacterium sp. H113 TaxID=3133419 RepID=UPI0030A017FC